MEETKKTNKNKAIPFVAGAVVVVAGFFGGRAVLHSFSHESTDNAQLESNAVPLVSRLAGFIDSLNVKDYEEVKKGQLLVSIDPREYQLGVQQAEMDLMNAEADVNSAQAELNNSIANMRAVMANEDVQNTRVKKATEDLKRDEALYKENAITKKQLDETRNNLETAQKQLTANQRMVAYASSQEATARAKIRKAQAAVETRKAALNLSKLKLSYCKIFAPVSGKIGRRNLEVGQYVQPGQLLTSIVNGEQFWIVANFKETQIEKMKLGQLVNIKLDGYPEVALTGKVSSFSLATGAKFSLLPPDNATGNFVKVTQRVPVKIDLIDEGKYKHILKAGLSAEVEVNIN